MTERSMFDAGPDRSLFEPCVNPVVDLRMGWYGTIDNGGRTSVCQSELGRRSGFSGPSVPCF